VKASNMPQLLSGKHTEQTPRLSSENEEIDLQTTSLKYRYVKIYLSKLETAWVPRHTTAVTTEQKIS
jgi:hypothetical protein